MLLDGATREEIVRRTGWKWSAVNSHFRSLRVDHDLLKVRSPDGRYIFDRRHLGIDDERDTVGPTTLSAEEAETETSGDKSAYEPTAGDHRSVITRQIRERRGRQQFRDALRKRYQDRCLVTGCEILDLLEAAHIKPYRGEADNHAENGLLLRADIHTLFDLDLLGIDPDHLRIELAPELANDNVYGKLAGRTLSCVGDRRPSQSALKMRYNQFRERALRPKRRT